MTTGILKLGHLYSLWPVSPLVSHSFLMCGSGRAIRGAFGEHGLNLIFQIKCAGWFRGCARRSLGVPGRPLSVHPVKGLSAAGVGVESEGSRRVHAASQECLCLSEPAIARGAAGEGRQRWCLCSCHVDPSLSPKITFFF